MRISGSGQRRQKVDDFSNNKRSNGSKTHPLKSAILLSRASRSEVRGVGQAADMPRAMPWAMRPGAPGSESSISRKCPLH